MQGFPRRISIFIPKLTNKRKSEVITQKLRMDKAKKGMISKTLDISHLNELKIYISIPNCFHI